MSTGSRNLASEPLSTLQGILQAALTPILRRLRSCLLQLHESDRRAVLALSDGLLLTLSCVSALAFAGIATAERGTLAVAFVALGMAALYASDQYSLEATDERAVLKAIAFSTVACLAMAWLQHDPMVLMPTLGLSGCLSLLAVLWSRVLWGGIFSHPLTSRRTLLLCDRPESEAALAELAQHPNAGWSAIGIGGSLSRANGADTVLAGPSAVQEPSWLSAMPTGIETLDLPRLFERLSRRVPVRFVDDRWFVEQFHWTRGFGYRFTKRALDLTLSLFGLLLSAPLFPLIALANLLGDRGPLLYSQLRVGLNGETFRVLKFRTMRPDAEKDGAVWARPDDNRVTRVGRFLRRSRLDEIPQLLNVLMGHMSLVGPRPERPEFVAELERQIPHYPRRHYVLPGITGWAQVRFPYGSSIDDAEEKLKFDLYYLKHRSIWFDLLILARTVSVVLNKTGSR